jgi:hypothetical protein
MCCNRPVTAALDPLPADIEALRAMLLAERAAHAETVARLCQERDHACSEIDRLRAIIQALQRHRFGRRAERFDADQLALALEDLEQSLAVAEARAAPDKTARPARRKSNRGALPAHLPREEVVVDIADKTCPCCAGVLHRIGSRGIIDPAAASTFHRKVREARMWRSGST